MYITKKLKNSKRLKNIKTLNSFIVRLFLIDEGRLFHRILPLKCIELRPKRNDLTAGRNTLIPFLKSYGIGSSLK